MFIARSAMVEEIVVDGCVNTTKVLLLEPEPDSPIDVAALERCPCVNGPSAIGRATPVGSADSSAFGGRR